MEALCVTVPLKREHERYLGEIEFSRVLVELGYRSSGTLRYSPIGIEQGDREILTFVLIGVRGGGD